VIIGASVPDVIGARHGDQLLDPLGDRLPSCDAILAALAGTVDDPVKGVIARLITEAGDDVLRAGP